jgi:hypothetical protein
MCIDLQLEERKMVGSKNGIGAMQALPRSAFIPITLQPPVPSHIKKRGISESVAHSQE